MDVDNSLGGTGFQLDHPNIATYAIGKGGLTDSLPPAVARIVDGARKLFEVRTMQEHWDLVHLLLTPDVVWQAPVIAIDNRQDLRVAVYLAKSIAYLTMRPHMVQVTPGGWNRTMVQVEATVTVSPKRSVLVPPSLLLPDLPIRASIKLGVRGPLESGQIELIDGRWHNLPSFPDIICGFNGFFMGSLMHLLEPLWSQGLWLVGDDSYLKSREQEAALKKLSDVNKEAAL